MQINFTGHNLEVTQELKDSTIEKFQRIKLRNDNIHSVHVTFHIENITHIAEANIHVDKTEIHAKAESKDMYTSINLLVDKLVAQLTKHKEKLTNHH